MELGIFIGLTVLAIMASVGSIFIAFLVGPQIGHYINSGSVLLTIILIFFLIKILVRSGNEIIATQRSLLIVFIIEVLLHLFIASIFISNHYGYKNCEYRKEKVLFSVMVLTCSPKTLPIKR